MKPYKSDISEVDGEKSRFSLFIGCFQNFFHGLSKFPLVGNGYALLKF